MTKSTVICGVYFYKKNGENRNFLRLEPKK
jgi:hypothetical protein